MRFGWRLVRNVASMILLGTAVGWWVTQAFPLSAPQREALRGALAASLVLEWLGAGGAVWILSRPLRAAADAHRRAGAIPTPLALRAAATGHRLPAYTAAVVLAAGVLATVVLTALARARGVPLDLGLAGAAVGFASASLAAMLCYALAGTTAGEVFERLGPDAEVAVQGTVRGKILILALGLITICVLLFAATGYVRYRGDIDREYVATAAHAQESAVASGAAATDAELAEHLWLVTGTPSAVLSPGGAVVARFGAGRVPFEGAATAAPGALRVEGGWLVSRATASGGRVVSWLPEEPVRARRRAFWGALSVTALVVYAATALLAWLAASAITLPFRTLGRAADRIASGDLAASPPSVSRDEMGQLAADFRRMAQGLKALVVDVQSASEGVSAGAREAGAIGERVRASALDQHAGAVAAQGAVEAMEGSIALVARGVGGLTEYVSATTQQVGEMASGLDEVRRKGAELERAMAIALRDVESLAHAGRDADATLAEQEQHAGHAAGTLSAVRSSIGTLERAAEESERTAEMVAEASERAGGVVEETVHGIEALRAAVADAHRRVAALGRRSDDIDQVVDFISEVAGRTSLLSLNASIIASQAGEHGKGFAVVAEQIRELAAQIARSTTSIGDIVRAVRDDVEGTAALIDRGDALAGEGVRLARNSLEALDQIRRSTAQGRETAAAIRAAVGSHAQSTHEVSLLVESVADGSRAVAAAVQLVGRSAAGVNTASRTVNAMADQVARALEDQSTRGRQQLESLGRVERMLAEIGRAVERHNAATRRVREGLRALSQTAGEHERAVEGLSGLAERLGARSRALAERVGRFKV